MIEQRRFLDVSIAVVIHARTDENRFALFTPDGAITHVVINAVRFFVAAVAGGVFADLLTLSSIDPFLLSDALRVFLLTQVPVEEVRAVDVRLRVISERKQTNQNLITTLVYFLLYLLLVLGLTLCQPCGQWMTCSVSLLVCRSVGAHYFYCRVRDVRTLMIYSKCVHVFSGVLRFSTMSFCGLGSRVRVEVVGSVNSNHNPKQIYKC